MSSSSTCTDPAVGVVAMACRYPDAGSPEELWKLLREGRHAFREVDSDRWKPPVELWDQDEEDAEEQDEK